VHPAHPVEIPAITKAPLELNCSWINTLEFNVYLLLCSIDVVFIFVNLSQVICNRLRQLAFTFSFLMYLNSALLIWMDILLRNDTSRVLLILKTWIFYYKGFCVTINLSRYWLKEYSTGISVQKNTTYPYARFNVLISLATTSTTTCFRMSILLARWRTQQ
jgi:hypothetical protein